MKGLKLKEVLVDYLESELLNVSDLGLDNEENYIKLLNKFWNREVEDRDVELKDLNNKDGFLYKLMCEWNELDFIKDNELGFLYYEYSLEDWFRDSFRIDGDFYKLFKVEDIDKMLYNN